MNFEIRSTSLLEGVGCDHPMQESQIVFASGFGPGYLLSEVDSVSSYVSEFLCTQGVSETPNACVR